MRGAGLAFIALVACGDSASPVEDAGAPDATSADAALPELEWPELSVGTTVDPEDPTRIGADARPADFSCLGLWNWPAPGADTQVDVELARNGAAGDVLADLCVRVYPDDVVGDAEPCGLADLRTDERGRASITVRADAPFALRVFGHDAPLAADRTFPSIVLDNRLALRGRVPGSSETALSLPVLTQSALAIIPLLTGRPILARSALVLAVVFDCAQRSVYGARMRLAHADGTYVEAGPTDHVPGYPDAAALPNADQQWTHIRGTVASGTRPVDGMSEERLVEIWGRPAGESEARVIGCAHATIEPDTMTNVAVEPLRAAGPSCPGMSRGQ